MKHFLLLISLAVTFLSGCSTSVPDCGDAKTTSMVSNLVLQSLLGEDAKNLSDMFKVEISAVQTVTHAKDPEKYTCKANVKITTTAKMGEFFGNARDEITRMKNHTMTESEAGKLKKYSAFVESIVSKPNYIDFSNLYFFGDDWFLTTYFKKDFKLFDEDRAEKLAEVATVVVFKTAITTTQLSEPTVIEFVSTTAQQDGSTQHLVEVQKLWKLPDFLLIELAKFAKTYDPAAKTVPASTVGAAMPVTAQNDLSKIFPSEDCTQANSQASKLICSSPNLMSMDAELSKMYKKTLADYPAQSDAITKEQLLLNETRDSCSDAECLLSLYAARRDLLRAAAL